MRSARLEPPRVAQDLDAIAAIVVQLDPQLRSLVLTGSFARGEGAVLAGRPRNDYDLVAVRGFGRPRVPYDAIRKSLEKAIGLKVDLAPVPAWRLWLAPPTIFWYETALRGRVLWGEDLRGRLGARTPAGLDRTEGLRLLVNRAAGLLLVAGSPDADEVRLQAAKAILAACDVELLAAGRFAPTQRERRAMWMAAHATPPDLPGGSHARSAGQPQAPTLRTLHLGRWAEWAYRTKTDPERAAPRIAADAWAAGRAAVLAAVPVALRTAGCASLDAYERRDTWLERAVWFWRSRRLPGARRLHMHATGLIRCATLRLLEDTVDGRLPAAAVRLFEPVVQRTGIGHTAALADDSRGTQDAADEALQVLRTLRDATLQ